jgi:hypothetical protein
LGRNPMILMPIELSSRIIYFASLWKPSYPTTLLRRTMYLDGYDNPCKIEMWEMIPRYHYSHTLKPLAFIFPKDHGNKIFSCMTLASHHLMTRHINNDIALQ